MGGGEKMPEAIDVSGGFEAVTTQVSSAITEMLPYAAVILAAFLAIRLGIRIYKRVTSG